MTNTDNSAQRNLAALRLPELRKIAAEMGLKGTSALRKGDLIAAINGTSAAHPTSVAPSEENKADAPKKERPARRRATKHVAQDAGSEPAPVVTEVAAPAEQNPAPKQEKEAPAGESERQPRRRRAVKTSVKTTQEEPTEVRVAEAAEATDKSSEEQSAEAGSEDKDNYHYESRSAARRARRNRARREQREYNRPGTKDESEASQPENENSRNDVAPESSEVADNSNEQARSDQADQPTKSDSNDNGREDNRRGNRHERGERGDRNDRGDRNRRNRRNRRGRDRDDNRDNRENNNNEPREDEVLQNVAGILDIVDNNVAFVRTSGYHAGAADVYVNNQMIRRLGLRSGDAIVGQVRMNGENNHGGHNRGRNRQKYNPLVRVDSVNGMTVEEAKARPEFAKLTPLYPNQRLRLETEAKVLTTRVIDLIMPIGKGQRALIVSPPKAGKTTILQNIANAIATNNPECYLMVVLVDERPEEVTDMQRSVKGEVIASTFDRPPSEHTAVAELAIERAKRLVEQGQDVVVLLDSITRLGRAYNNSSPASGRILSGGVDSNALYPPKRFLGAARNIENGGSLTIIATAMVETGSAGDTVIFEEFKGTGNAELKLDRKISERRVFPAVDVNPSGTRKDELLLAPEEARIMHKLRRMLSALDNQQAIDLLIKQLKKTKSNGEFLMQVASSAPMAADAEED
ncbi:transcription termination factor Rho [Corynebacterium diphtheriae]|uniref:transcription termination factor Rho n=1 Tax=Corynebacterium diphtheriae TaxID=1717 RepID=UPI000928E5E6|nr:transcription termination factor Rho [Corynebacterium diphtheriae]APM35248.1 transcription termination factor Rho [Corynebacterium diphtheriae]OJH89754.1 transcription termination factor Rho [Corynebacterium diphtheriae]OJH90692.1 transcription termination factor Rho [Corynebacterium diphtheriae]OJH97859.1 transcription termination factor Rho [Corynebacterium diphtheriae]OSQ00296.1 transcription termination factor Rho [Corynebacterium diphtheriae]